MDVLTDATTELKATNIQESQFATVGEVFDDGVTLIFDGQEEATDKHYKVNVSITFNPGDRVKICKDSGTYVVEYVVGAPNGANSNISTVSPNEYGFINTPVLTVANHRMKDSNDRTKDIQFSCRDDHTLLFRMVGDTGWRLLYSP